VVSMSDLSSTNSRIAITTAFLCSLLAD